jgi:iron complex outermembrane receptor protein
MYTRAVALASLFVVASLTIALTQDTPKITPLPEVVVTAPPEKAAPRRRPPARPGLARAGRVAPGRTLARGASARVANAATSKAPGPNTAAGPGGIGSAPGQTLTAINRDQFDDRRTFTIGSVLQDSPGVDIKQGNGPRDVGISIRGSNARNGFGIRNIVMLEDGFPITQPDGLSRSDTIDPHAYSAIDVYRGPSSAYFGNYATGGALNLRTRTGAQVNGYEFGSDMGSFGYFNNYMTIGRQTGPLDYSLFISDVMGQGFIANSAFNTPVLDFLGSYAITPNDLITTKVISNYVATQLPLRLSLNQFQQNPFQKGCAVAAGAAPGCATAALFANGMSGAMVPDTAQQAGFGRHDYRNIVGVRWDHDLDNDTTWRTQLVFDDKNINQPTGATSAIGNTPSLNAMSDVTKKNTVAGLDFTHFAGLFYNIEGLSNYTYNVAPGGNATLAALSSFYNSGQQENAGGRVREEIKFNNYWTAVLGADMEHTNITTVNNIYSFPGGVPTATAFPIGTNYLNNAEEAGLRYRPNTDWQFRGRVATGYGTPNIGQLTVTPQGVSGNNSALTSQTNLGFDLGADWTPVNTLTFSVTGFYEFFKNEIVTQSPGVGLLSYSFNAPASEHRGVEVAVDWKPWSGWRLLGAYTYLNEVYTNYIEQLSAGNFTAQFNRDGNRIPGVSPNELLVRLGYDQPVGPYRGLGAFVQFQWKDGYFIDNANLIKVPAFELVNVNVHYNVDFETSTYFKSAMLYFEVRNILNTTYVASANNISDSLNTTTGAQNPGSVLATTGTGSIYAGEPRAVAGGVRFAFR